MNTKANEAFGTYVPVWARPLHSSLVYIDSIQHNKQVTIDPT